MMIQTVDLSKAWQVINAWWGRSMIAVLLFFLGLFVGGINAESRIVSDCKFAGAFRVDIQAFVCQRKL